MACPTGSVPGPQAGVGAGKCVQMGGRGWFVVDGSPTGPQTAAKDYRIGEGIQISGDIGQSESEALKAAAAADLYLDELKDLNVSGQLQDQYELVEEEILDCATAYVGAGEKLKEALTTR